MVAVAYHDAISSDFGKDASGSDAPDLCITFDDTLTSYPQLRRSAMHVRTKKRRGTRKRLAS